MYFLVYLHYNTKIRPCQHPHKTCNHSVITFVDFTICARFFDNLLAFCTKWFLFCYKYETQGKILTIIFSQLEVLMKFCHDAINVYKRFTSFFIRRQFSQNTKFLLCNMYKRKAFSLKEGLKSVFLGYRVATQQAYCMAINLLSS